MVNKLTQVILFVLGLVGMALLGVLMALLEVAELFRRLYVRTLSRKVLRPTAGSGTDALWPDPRPRTRS